MLETFCSTLRTVFSYMQALYFCTPFREQLLDYYGNHKNPGDAEENLLTCLADLFSQVNAPPVISCTLLFRYYLIILLMEEIEERRYQSLLPL